MPSTADVCVHTDVSPSSEELPLQNRQEEVMVTMEARSPFSALESKRPALPYTESQIMLINLQVSP